MLAENREVEIVALRRSNDALRKAAAIRAAYGINFYRPHAKQHKFHVCDKTGRFLRTGNRFGKSECGIVEDVSWCLGGRLWYRESFDILDGEKRVVESHVGTFDHPYVTRGIPKHPVKGLLLVVDWDMAKSIFTNQTSDPKTCGKLWKFLPKSAIKEGGIHLSRGGHVDQIEINRPAEFGGGISTLKIDTIESWKHNKLGSESDDWDFIHIDEPIPEAMFKGYSRGLMDRHGSYWFTCTPLDQMWINDKFAPNPALGQKVTSELRAMIVGSIYDNPHRNAAGVAEFASGLTPEEKQCRLDGVPLEMAGLVYKEFIWDVHVLADVPKGWAAYNDPPKNYTIRVWWDVHISKHQAILFFATAPDGTVFVYDEQFYTKYIKENAELLVEKTTNRFVATYEIDPNALVDNPVDDTNIVDTLNEYGLFFNPATKDRTRGTIKVAEKLRERGHTKLPTIFFSPHLKQTLFEFTHYTFDLATGKPVDKDDHMMENLYRAILSGLDYIDPPDDSEFVPRDRSIISHQEYHNSPNRF